MITGCWAGTRRVQGRWQFLYHRLKASIHKRYVVIARLVIVYVSEIDAKRSQLDRIFTACALRLAVGSSDNDYFSHTEGFIFANR